MLIRKARDKYRVTINGKIFDVFVEPRYLIIRGVNGEKLTDEEYSEIIKEFQERQQIIEKAWEYCKEHRKIDGLVLKSLFGVDDTNVFGILEEIRERRGGNGNNRGDVKRVCKRNRRRNQERGK